LRILEKDKLEAAQSSPLKLGFERRPTFRSGIMVDDSLAGNAVPAIKAISRVNIVRRKERLHNNLQTRIWQSRNSACLADSTAVRQEI
jgi:hypothetical protein